MDLVRLGLERGRTADDALDVITAALAEHGQGGSGEHGRDEPYFSSFLIVDARGGWVLETSARSWAARPVGDGSAISNRISLTTDWTRASTDVEPGADFDRWRVADDRRRRSRITGSRRPARASPAERVGQPTAVADVVATLRDHGNGPWGAPGRRRRRRRRSPLPDAHAAPTTEHVTVCMHVRGYQATTASLVVELPRRRAAARVGVPREPVRRRVRAVLPAGRARRC